MESRPRAWNDEELRRHAEWLRGLARALVGDAATADDLAQDAWLVRGTRQLPSDEVRPFLTGVVRRLASQWRRSVARRGARERDSARPERTPSADHLLEQLDTQEFLLHSLRGLTEACRDALLLRYFEGLEIDEIARRSGTTPGTVRSRLSRGLAELRERLDRRHPSGREGWTLALLPMLRPRHVAAAGAGAFGVLGAMGTKGLVACAVVALGLVAWWISPGEVSLPEAALAKGNASLREGGPAATDAATTDSRVVVERSAPDPTTLPESDPAATEYKVIGRVLDASLQPLGGAVVRVGTETIARSAQDGTFELTLRDALATRPWPLTVDAPAHRRWMTPFDPGSATTLWVGDIELEGSGSLVGRVVDSVGLAVAGARVLARRGTLKDDPDDFELLSAFTVRSDPTGAFEFPDLGVGAWTLLVASHERPWSASTQVELRAGAELSLTLRAAEVDPSRCIAGTVKDSSGAPLEWVNVQLRQSASEGGPRITLSDAEGRFEFHLASPDGTYRLEASELDKFESITLDGVRPGQTQLELVFAAPVPLRVRVVDAAGAPVHAARVHAGDTSRALLAGCEARSDEQGACELRRPSETFQVFAVAAGFAPRIIGPWEPGSEPAEVLVQLERATGIRGRVLRDGEPVADAEVGLFAALAPGEARVVRHWKPDIERFGELRELPPASVTRSAADGSFALSLPSSVDRAPHGWYVIARRSGFAHVVLGPVSPDPGAGVDGLELRLSRGGRLAGRVRSGPDDPAGLVVWARDGLGGDARGFVGPDGQFQLEPLAAGQWQVRIATLAEWSLMLTQPFEFGEEWSGATRESESPPEFPVRIREGETTWLELDAPHGPRWTLHGEFVVAADPKGAWSVRLDDESVKRDYELNEDGWLDADGRFSLRYSGAGPWRMTFASLDPRWGRLVLRGSIRPEGSELRWRGELQFARLSGRSLAGKRGWGCDGRLANGMQWSSSFELREDSTFEDVWIPAGHVWLRHGPASSAAAATVELDLAPGERRAIELP
jgi:RNA polymerase sigma factor (sigma-70 family)